MRVIGLSGFARVGKDEVAKILVRDHGFKQLAFADKMRDFLYAVNPLVIGEQLTAGGNFPVFQHLQTIVGSYGWDGYKESIYGAEIRRLLQRLGTEAGRQVLGENVWVDATLNNLPDGDYVVSDARFFNEFDGIRNMGGEIWRITRPNVGPLNGHASEMEATNYRHFAKYISNDGTLEDLAKRVQESLENVRQDSVRRGVVTYDMTRGEN